MKALFINGSPRKNGNTVLNHESFCAPCQCLTSAGTAMTVPGVISTGALPHS